MSLGFANRSWAVSWFPFFFISFFNSLKHSICRITGRMNSQSNCHGRMYYDKFRCIMRFFSKLKYFIHHYKRNPTGCFIHLSC